MLPFPFLNPAIITAEKDVVSRYRISEVPLFFVSWSPITSQSFAAQSLSRVSMCPTPLTPLTVAVQTLNVPNVSYSSRDFALAALCFLRADVLSARFPRLFFRVNAPRLSLSSTCFLARFLPSFFQRVGCGTPILACALRAFLLSWLRDPRFPRRRCSNFATAGTVDAGNDFALLGCITAS